MLLRQRLVVGKHRDDSDKITLERLSMWAFGFAFQITFELA